MSITIPAPASCKSVLFILVAVLLLGGCSSLQYYSQSIRGHLDLMNRRQAIDMLIADPGTPAALRTRLQSVLEIRDYATGSLALPDNDSYRSYADIERDYVVWNVFAAPALSLEPVEWCFLLVGCLQYRGYHAEAAARQFAAQLQDQDYDVYVGGAIAYSTLGWFNDPVLNTMLRLDDMQLARVIFHELAHQQFFVAGDTGFNEAFAETVALTGVERWLRDTNRTGKLDDFRQSIAREDQFIALLLDYRGRLRALYDSDKPRAEKLAGKRDLFDELGQAYAGLRAEWGNHDGETRELNRELNNARLVAIAAYRELIPGFTSLLAAVNDNLPRFYERVEHLAECSPAERREILTRGNADFSCPAHVPASRETMHKIPQFH